MDADAISEHLSPTTNALAFATWAPNKFLPWLSLGEESAE